MYAIIKTGGKQYRAEKGSRLRVEKLEANPGDTVEFEALMLGGEQTVIGSPTVPGAKVVAEVVEHGKGKKVVVAKFKAKVQYRRKRGHRQPYTEILVKDIRA
ncbi:50S ribosomal protein L21 [Meiothermus taiwanensis]|jgi:large subunit ribosomal protein L21|uniref:Large ribosomal subunit protein bL21 n=2 Tax=Meiothermus taiwanensis TaxID=172827 RepID=A0A399E4F3_9DEIN|nr:50S ribosomal protein L21 [Meiothermus taiwanensis]AWR87391.1 ribosomal protein L21 [Meiothermus taiwanensis WR-220]KIQ55968.1 50S ribosomal protein L21 [Meiothermus taiwanensis]KZK15732.1 50S ribosomal protein L21 [Meiothermus taiwanensis]RIH79614.1 50S ribosomal protein L21 [Meiothermus taiwanensis]